MLAPSPAAPTPAAAGDLIGRAGHPRKPISRARIETVISRSVAGSAVVFGLQALPIMVSQLDERKPVPGFLAPALLALAISLVVLSTTFKFGIRSATGAVAVIYLIALLAWPFLAEDPSAVLDGKPWLWYVLTVGTSCAAIAFPVVWASIYTVLAPAVYGVVRTLPSGGGADALLASLDAIYAILLGQVVVIMIFMLRQASESVDVAQTNALHKYAIAVRQHATEVERVEVDSIVHDTVLATLLSAAGARSPKAAELAVSMAENAIARLDEAGTVPAGDEPAIPFAQLSERLRAAATAQERPFTIIEEDLADLTVPVHAAEALYSAAVQAMVNSVQHAGREGAPVTRTLSMRPNLMGGCTIEVSDTGVGFDQETVPSERLGLRVSIQDRVTSAGGAVRVRTAPGHGTSIVIEWPEPDDPSDALAGRFSTDELPVLGLDGSSPEDGGGTA